jgi:hypothetical protein
MVVDSGFAKPAEEVGKIEELEIGSESRVLGPFLTPSWSASYLHDGDDRYICPDGFGEPDTIILLIVWGATVVHAAVGLLTQS